MPTISTPRPDGPEAWRVAFASLAILSLAHGAPMIGAVALKPMAAEFGAPRGAIALAGALTYAGAAFGGVAAGWIAARFDTARVVMTGGTMLAAGLALSAHGGLPGLQVGHGVFIGLLGNACMLSPLFAYVSFWFVRHRGTAIALLSCGQSIAGLACPLAFAWSIDRFGWRWTMNAYALLCGAAIVLLAACFLKPPPALEPAPGHADEADAPARRGTPLLMAVLMAAIFFCCVPMNMPLQHIVAFCGDLGFASRQGASMLAVLLATGLLARLFWGRVADRAGGLPTLAISATAQLLALAGFLATQDEATLFIVAAAFGFGFTGLLPAYVITIREHFPAREATWRVPAILLAGYLGMATGGWGAGLAFDRFGSYRAAFGLGIAFNLVTLVLLLGLLARERALRGRRPGTPGLVRALAASLRARARERRRQRQCEAVLGSLGDRTLKDLGLHRSEIGSVVMQPDDRIRRGQAPDRSPRAPKSGSALQEIQHGHPSRG